MRNFTLSQSKLFRLNFLVLLLTLASFSSFAQVCGTPGVDGPITVTSSINTYYPISGNTTLSAGAESIFLAASPGTDGKGNNFGTIPISAGDLILIIQMQDASINYTNDSGYGAGNPTSGPDGLGGTGFTAIGNTGVFEYVIATNNVPLGGGNLTFKGTGVSGGTRNSFVNANATTDRGKKTFQIVRVPQYSNLTLNKDITTPAFNGSAGGIIAFNVSGTFNFNEKTIDGTARGFRGGYSPRLDSNLNNSKIYVGLSTNDKISGKGEGIAGTPRYMWDGSNEVDNGVTNEGLPGGSSGRGAPGNAGGGGNDHNTGGGGGGNGGFGGLGGAGWQGGNGDVLPATGGGRPGYKSYITSTPFPKLIMGGGGGAGDANNASTGVKGGVGGAIILINAGTVQGIGYINANGGNGAAGTYSGSPDGAGGGGAGGTVLLNISNNSTGTITINANGGNGGNTENDNNNEHGPGGGGGGGIISHNLITSGTIISNVNGGSAGKSNAGQGNNHGAVNGTVGYKTQFTTADVPPNLQVNASCFPTLETDVKSLSTAKACNSIGEKVSYEIKIKNTGAGNAAGVFLDFSFPSGIQFDSATATYSIGTTGPSGALTNTNTAAPGNPLFGGFNIAQNGVVTVTLIGKVAGTMAAGVHSSDAQALYLDPTRTGTNSARKITAATNAYGSVNKNYEGNNQADVPGVNFTGTGKKADDITILALPAVPAFTPTQPTCGVPTGTITVNTPANGTGISYTLTGTNPVTASVNNETGAFSGLVAGTYKLTTTNSEGCISLPTADITINALAGAPTTTGVSICQGDTTGAALVVTSACSSGTIQWFTEASEGTAIATGSSFNPVGVDGSGLTDTNTAKTVIYYASCSGSCRTATSFVIKPKPTITAITSNSRCDAGTVILGATASSGTINWYAASIDGPSLGTGSSFTTPSISTTTDYYVDATDNGCTTGTRTAVKATVNTLPTINSTIEGANCGAGAVTLSATASTGATINWYNASTGGSLQGTGPTFITPSLSSTTTYYVGATTAEGCTTASRIAVAAVINTASTITFTSGLQSPTVCAGTAIPSTVYTFGGSAINATASSLPAGLRSDVDSDAKTITISGTPTASGTYRITTFGHTAPCIAATIDGIVTVTPNNTASVASSTPTLCINTVLTSITHTTTGATGIGTATGLPSGVSAAWASNKITISGTPTVSGVFNYTIPLTGGCGTINATGKITVTGNNTVSAASATPTLCINTVLTSITHTTTGATGIGTATGLPSGVTAAWASNTITISGTPTLSGVFNYTIPLTGGCGTINATGKITVTGNNTVSAASATPTLCINTVLTSITHTTTGATGIGTATGLPSGVTAAWASNTITISGTPTVSGIFDYTIPLTGGCGTINVTGKITVTGNNTVSATSATPTLCINTVLTSITHTTTGATGIGTATGLPSGVTAAWASNTITISGTPTVSGVFDYTIPLTGGCGAINATGKITVTGNNTVSVASATPTLCINMVLTSITHTTTGATGIGTATGLPSGVTAAWASNTITISGTPTVSGVFDYTIPLTGGCGAINATGKITVTGNNTVSVASSTPTLCINTVLTSITHTTTGATGIGTATGLPSGVTAAWGSNTITISGTPTVSGIFDYTIPLTGGCGTINATGKITVTGNNTVSAASATPTLCINTVLTSITHTTTGATGIGTATGLPSGVTAAWASNTITISGTPTVSGVFDYTIPLTGGCGVVNATGKITVSTAPNAGTLSGTQDVCVGSTSTFASNGDTGSWTSNDTAIATVDSSTGVITGKTAGTATITYTVTETGGCTNATSDRTITVSAAPNAGTLSGTQDVCVGSTSTFASNGDTGSWTSSDTAIATVDSSTGVITGKTAGTATITYTVIGTGRCTNATSDRTITVSAAPNAGTLSGTQEICVGSTSTFASNGDAGSWTSNDTAIATVDSSTGVITGKTAGTATITYTVIGTGGCTNATSDRTITVSAAPNAGTLSGTQDVCVGSTSTFASNGDAGSWTSNDTAIATVDSSTGVITGKTAGTATITYTVIGTGGCTNATSDRTVTVNFLPTALITGTLNACLTTTLNAVTDAASPTYVWYKNNDIISSEISSSLIVNSDGDYKVKVRNTTTGCEETSAVSTVKVSDTQKPTISCLANVEVSADANLCTASGVVLGTPTTSDNCIGTLTVTNDAPSVFPIGSTTVTWTAEDASGNKQTCTQVVKVVDTQKPTISCPANVEVSADANLCTASGVVLGTPTTSDNCSGTLTVTNDAPLVFPIGSTTITWTAEDASGNKQTCNQVVKVIGPIIANDDKVVSINGYDGGTAIADVLENDLLNCSDVIRSEVILTLDTTLPSVLTFDTTTGKVTVKPNTPTGTYSFNYKICEVSNSSNCNTATVEVKVTAPAILAVKETLGPINGSTGGETTSLIASDKLNNIQAVIGSNPGQVTLTGTAPAGLTINTTDGTVTVNAGVKAGSYDVEYTICDNNNLATNCSTVTSTVTVTSADLVANLDAAGSVVGGNTSQTLINVFENDTKNGAKLDPSDVKLTPGTDPKGYLTIDANGNAVLGANAPAGNYELTYEICELLNPKNCATNKVEVIVTAPAILAVKETLGPINGSTGGKTTSLIASDKLNGLQAIIGSNPGQVTLTGTAPTGLIVNADGTVTVSAGVKEGSYDVEYTICDNNNLATNCSTATSTVTVTAADLVANLDSAGSVVGGNTSQTLLNVFENDTKNGAKLDPSDVKLTPGTDPKGYLTIDANGNAVLGANAPAGNYELTYEICELLNPTNCATNKVEVTVTAPAILAVKETFGPINGSTGGETTSLIASDKLNNIQAVIGSNPGQVTLTGTAPTGLTINTTDGTVTVSAGVKAGSYDVEYTICDNNNAGNCSTVTSTVVVTSADLVANLDSVGSVVGGNTSQTLINVFENDTKNGAKLDPSDVKLTPGTDPKGYLTIDANGNAVLGANAPAGNYELTYEICELLNPTNCATNKVEVTVTAPAILAVKETLGPINGSTGGKTTSLIASDKLNNIQAVIGSNPGQVTLTGTAPAGLTINTTDGTVTVSAGVKAGSYDVEYTICDNNNAGNCSTVTSTVVVTAADLVANLDSAGSVVGGNTSQTLVNVFENDTKNGAKLDPSDVKLTPGTDPKGYLTIDANGNAVLGANAPAGNYELTYEICELLNPTNCATNKVEVTVTAPDILAVKETLGPINGSTGGETTSLIASDKLNNIQAVIGSNPGQVTLTGTAPTGLTINTTDGTVTVSAGVKAGSYDVEYTICDNNNAGNCSTITSTVTVTSADLVANLDSAGSVVGGNTSQTLVNVLENDTKNGAKLDPLDVKLTPGTDPKGYLTIDNNGNAVLGANAPGGKYELTYEICELLNPSNCATNKVEVTVTAPDILAVKETLGPINGSTGGETTSLIASDKLNNIQAVIGSNPGQVTLTATAPAGLTVNTTDGTVTVSAGVKAGSYDVEYTICDNNNAGNCSTVTSTVVVTAADLVANLDSVGSVVGGNTPQTLINIFENDTKNGAKLDPSDVKLTSGTDPKGYLTIDTNGNAVLGANAPAGNYELTYEICELLNPTNCATNKVEVTVTAPAILAVKENLGTIGGTTTSLIASDKLNGVQAVIGSNPGQVTLTATAPTGFTVNTTDGTVTVSAGVKAGSYDVEYTICDNNNPGTNCSTATSTVVVTSADLVANLDSVGSVVGGNTPQTLINIFDNDTKNGTKLNTSDVKLTPGTDPKGYLTIDVNGNAVLGANAPAGKYELTYEICELLNPTNCATNKVEVTVTPAVIQANNDNAGTVDSSKGQSSTTSIFDNDTLNGSKVNPADVILTTLVPNPNLILKANGTIEVKPGTPTGTYELTYQICEALNPTINCSQAIAKISVVNNPPITPLIQIIANNDGVVNVDGINGALEFINVLDNDLIKGLPVNPLEIILSNTPSPYFEFNSDGTVNVKPNTPGGSYSLTYQVCEKSNPNNCASAILSVFVEVPSIAIIKTAVFNDENGSGFANAGETITYKFKVTNTGNVPLTGVMISDPLPGVVVSGQAINLNVNESDEHNFTATYKITQTDINKGSVSNQASVQARSAKGVVVDDLSDDENETGDKPTVLGLNGCEIKVFNAFSPNGDDINSRFYIRGLECYPDNTVEIYNRWGVLVYDINNYNNEDRAFKGFSEGRTTVKQSEGLPVGTYFYILKYKDSGSNPHELSGYLYINK